jgi:hypothetical protein
LSAGDRKKPEQVTVVGAMDDPSTHWCRELTNEGGKTELAVRTGTNLAASLFHRPLARSSRASRGRAPSIQQRQRMTAGERESMMHVFADARAVRRGRGKDGIPLTSSSCEVLILDEETKRTRETTFFSRLFNYYLINEPVKSFF